MAKFIIEGERFFEPYRSQHVSLERAIKTALGAIHDNKFAPQKIRHKGEVLWERSFDAIQTLERLARLHRIKL